MKQFLIALMCCLGIVYQAQAQSSALTFEYDAAGNRVKRFDPPGKTEILPITTLSTAITTKLFPNPTANYVTIQASAELIDGVLVVNDISGHTLTQQPFSGTENILNLSTLPTGIYFVRLTGKDYEQLWKVIKQ